jgi:hypothetical protein
MIEDEDKDEDEDMLSSPVERAQVLASRKQLLRSVEIFQACDDGFLASLAERLIKKHFEKGEYVLAKDEGGGSIYFIHSGSVDVLPALDLPKINTLGVGSYFGEASALTTNKVNAYVMAAEALECYVLRERDVEYGVSSVASVAEQLTVQIKKREVERERHRSSAVLAASMMTGQDNFEVKWRQGRPSRSTPRNVLLSVTGMGITVFDSVKTMRPLQTVIFESVSNLSCTGPEGLTSTLVIECRDGSSLSFATAEAAKIEAAAQERLAHIAAEQRREAFIADREAGAARRKAQQAEKPLTKKELKQKEKEEKKRRKEEEKNAKKNRNKKSR